MANWNTKGCMGHTQTLETRKKISEALKKYKKTYKHQLKITKALKGRKMPKDFGEKISKALRGRKLPEEVKVKLRGKHRSPKTEFKKGQVSPNKGKKASPETRLKQSLARKGRFCGEKCPTWKGGITPETRRIRNSIEYGLWRNKIFERDNFTCLNCGQSNCNLNAHHVEPFSVSREKRLDFNNGVTLCKECHLELHRN